MNCLICGRWGDRLETGIIEPHINAPAPWKRPGARLKEVGP